MDAGVEIVRQNGSIWSCTWPFSLTSSRIISYSKFLYSLRPFAQWPFIAGCGGVSPRAGILNPWDACSKMAAPGTDLKSGVPRESRIAR